MGDGEQVWKNKRTGGAIESRYLKRYEVEELVVCFEPTSHWLWRGGEWHMIGSCGSDGSGRGQVSR